jgi:hypothetical protein
MENNGQLAKKSRINNKQLAKQGKLRLRLPIAYCILSIGL